MSAPHSAAHAWAVAARAALGGSLATYDVWIVSVQPRHAAGIRARLAPIVSALRTSRGAPPRLLIVPEHARRPGNLVGTLLAWKGACARAREQRWDLRRTWRAGGKVVLLHAAGQGRRAAPLVHAEDGDRGALWLPGTVHGRPARLLEAVLTQIAPLALSQPSGVLDVIWASQLFLPQLDPHAVPAPSHALTKLATGRRTSQPGEHADVGMFLLRDGHIQRFVPQGQPAVPARGGRWAADLGSFRLRSDLLDVLCAHYLDPLPDGPRDLDPHLTGPLLGSGGATEHEARAVRQALGQDELVGLCELGEDIPWWRLRRPAELRSCALSVRPSSPETALRTLLGVEHPIRRSWLGDTWIEGPELSFEQVREGVDVGGVRIVDSIIQDSAISAWPDRGLTAPAVRRCVVQGATGGLDLEDTWFVCSGGPAWRGGGGMAWRVTSQPPAAAGPSPTALGICTVRRPRLRDGQAVYHGFLDEDAKASEARARAEGPGWSELAHLPAFAGPSLDPRRAPELDERQPHVILQPEAPVLAWLRERVPPRTDLARLVELLEAGRFVIALHRGSRAIDKVEAPLVPGRTFRPAEQAYRLHGDLETWRRLQWSRPRMAEALLHALVLSFIPAGSRTREALAARRLSQLRQGAIEARSSLQTLLEQRVLDGDAGSVLDRVTDWRIDDDPDRVDLAAIFDALDVLAPPPAALRTEAHLRAWCRWRLERAGDVAGVITDRLATIPASLLGRAGFVWQHPWVDHGQPVWIPRFDLRPRRVADKRVTSQQLVSELTQQLGHRDDCPVLGVCGPAAAGKSSLAVSIAEALDGLGLRVGFLAADRYCWQGDGFRYTQHEHVRDTLLYGPGIVDELGLAWAIDQERQRCDCVIVEGAYVGRDPELRSRLDLLVAVLIDDRTRLEVKFGRDALGGKRRIDVVTDFADKVHHESRDGVAPILPFADRIWDRGTGELWLGPAR